MKLNLLITTVLILTWATPGFCPLTFGQGSSLKALPRTPENIARAITAVEAAAGDKDPGIKVLIKHFGSAATKAALLEKLRAELATLSGRPDTATAAAAPARASHHGGGGGGGSAAAVPVRASHGGGGAGVSMASKPLGDIDALEESIAAAYTHMNAALAPLLVNAIVLKNAIATNGDITSAEWQFMPGQVTADRIIRTFIENIKIELDNAENNYLWSDTESLTQIITTKRLINNDLLQMNLEKLYTATSKAVNFLIEKRFLSNEAGIRSLETEGIPQFEKSLSSPEITRLPKGQQLTAINSKVKKIAENLAFHKQFINQQIAEDLVVMENARKVFIDQCQSLLAQLDPESEFIDETLDKLTTELANIVKICLEKVRMKAYARLDTIKTHINRATESLGAGYSQIIL